MSQHRSFFTLPTHFHACHDEQTVVILAIYFENIFFNTMLLLDVCSIKFLYFCNIVFECPPWSFVRAATCWRMCIVQMLCYCLTYLQSLLNSAARLIFGTRQFDQLPNQQLMGHSCIRLHNRLIGIQDLLLWLVPAVEMFCLLIWGLRFLVWPHLQTTHLFGVAYSQQGKRYFVCTYVLWDATRSSSI